MVLLGKTQNEIADSLGITQSAVHKALRGNLDYRNDRKRYGGIFKKLKKICGTNPGIQDILNKIDKTKEETSA
jgi:predicted transcriptional regulator